MVRAAALVIALVGCSVPGRTIREWTVESRDVHDLHVTLPSTFLGRLGWREVDYTMHTCVALAPSERGETLTLAFECYHGPLHVIANGIAVEDIGDNAIGEHRYIIPPATTAAGTLDLMAAGHVDLRSLLTGMNGPARLSIGAHREPSAIAVMTRYQFIVTVATSAAIGLLFALLFALDRSRRADGAYAIQVVMALSVPFYGLAWLPVPVLAAMNCTLWLAGTACIHYEFKLGPPPRWLVGAFVACIVAALASTWSFALGRATYSIFTILLLATYVHLIRKLVGVARSGSRRLEANLLWISLASSVVMNVLGFLNLFEIHVFEDLHIYSAGGVPWLLAQLFVLARGHVASRRESERARVELQRQVAERSKDLAEALARLSRQSDALAPEHVIDGRYRVVKTLGAGGMGVVYEVERLGDKQRLAVKTVRRGDMQSFARFAREAQVAAEHSHPNLLSVVDVGISDGALFLVMPLVSGGSLDKQRGRFGDRAWAMPLLAQVANGLAALHARGIVHRDLKPANVLLDNGVARIADFGLASLAARSEAAPARGADSTVTAAAGKAGLTRAGDVFGTPPYMAPELAVGVEEAKPSSDIFAFGLIAYELVLGRQAFSEPPLVARLAGRAIGEPAPAEIAAILTRCLALDPTLRPSAAELAAELDR